MLKKKIQVEKKNAQEVSLQLRIDLCIRMHLLCARIQALDSKLQNNKSQKYLLALFSISILKFSKLQQLFSISNCMLMKQ